MKSDRDLKIVLFMEEFGGGFVNALAKAMLKADAENFAILRGAFDHLFVEYAQMAALRNVEVD